LDHLKNNSANHTSTTSRGGRRPGAGRPKGKVSEAKRSIAQAAREHAEVALKVLVDVARDVAAPPSARVSAANAILDRGYGKPVAQVEMSINPLEELIREITSRGSAMPISTSYQIADDDEQDDDDDDFDPLTPFNGMAALTSRSP
jgi:predicted ArsR family transcriptional regulator